MGGRFDRPWCPTTVRWYRGDIVGASNSEVTQLLEKLRSTSERDAADWQRLLNLVYDELRRIANALMAREPAHHTLQPTALVHEVYMRLVDRDHVHWNDRSHFLSAASRAMRNILVDHARAKQAAKRGGGQTTVVLDERIAGDSDPAYETLELNDALQKLGRLDERAAQVAEMRLFGAMTVTEMAHALGVSSRTVDNDWASARLWLSRELSAP